MGLLIYEASLGKHQVLNETLGLDMSIVYEEEQGTRVCTLEDFQEILECPGKILHSRNELGKYEELCL